MKASESAAIFAGRGAWAASQARLWIREFKKSGKLPLNIQGSWNESIIEDEDLAAAIREHLRCIGKYAGPHDVVEFFRTPAANEFSHLLDAPPCLRTAQRWMHNMGYRWATEKRGQYADGHEREDVVEYRKNRYVPDFIERERRMRSWKGDEEIPPSLNEGKMPEVEWSHDESIYRAHDRRMMRWIHEGETSALYKKGEGMSLMVADIVSGEYGFLKRTPETLTGNKDDDARVVFRPGKERDGYFCNEDVCDQLLRAIKIVKDQYPDEKHVFVFDNATTHTKLPEDTPIVGKMTLGPSQKVKGEKTGTSGEKIKVNFAPAQFADGSQQDLYYPLNHPTESLRGEFKGLAKLLEERGIPGARKLKLQCPSTGTRKGCAPGRTDCCARRTMMSQLDFQDQKTILQRLAESHGCLVKYLPKYHCELNPIEQCWGMSKRIYRDSPMSSTEADLERNMLASLDAIPLNSIRKFVTRSRRFIHAYHDGLSGEQAAWANKLYHGHRMVTETVMQMVDNLEPSDS
ncbi:hypothetical protein BDV93DRAFT_455579 [Ceratobasidium sp. AG-I]|nr:hypothetical protein BDV93DRAFT_455579 [Ceratobasidium sp. AG-I]